MAWRVARSLQALRSAFDARFPNRDRSSDGSIGDDAHQGSASGHNPDDTPGSLPESTDADTDAEVRAIDVDDDLGEPDMLGVVNAVLATPADRDRLLYIIYDRKIWSKSQGWRERAYTGSNPHTSHAHWSGDPAFDEDTRPWTSVLNYGRSPSTEEDDVFVLTGTDPGSPTKGTYLITGLDLATGRPWAIPISSSALADYKAAGIAHRSVPNVNAAYYSIKAPPLTATVAVELTDEQLAEIEAAAAAGAAAGAASPEEIADAVVDEQAERLND